MTTRSQSSTERSHTATIVQPSPFERFMLETCTVCVCVRAAHTRDRTVTYNVRALPAKIKIVEATHLRAVLRRRSGHVRVSSDYSSATTS